jgi:transcriptional regulator with XRE-family HTH domain
MVAPTVRQQRLAAELRRLREQAGYTGDEAAQEMGWSPAKISRLETAKSRTQPVDVRRLLAFYRINGERHTALMTLADEARKRGWWEEYSDLPGDYSTYIGLEDEADSAAHSDTLVVPGLLQTEDYALEIVKGWNAIATITPQEIERRVDVRMRRQQVLFRPDPLTMSIILDESVLARRHGSPATMRKQLERLLEFTDLPTISLQILPLAALHTIVADSFIILAFSPIHDVVFPDVVHVEGIIASHKQDESATHMYRLAHEHLAAQALDLQASRDLVLRTIRELW